VRVNRAAADASLVDFDAAPLDVATGGDPVTLDMKAADGELLRATGHLTLDVAGFFAVEATSASRSAPPT